jgi:hypothetical protein
MALPTVQNTRTDPHFPLPDEYLIWNSTHPLGDQDSSSIDPSNVGSIVARVTEDGSYTTRMLDKDGNMNEMVHGGVKSASASHTSSIAGHVDAAIGGSHRVNIGTGRHTEIAAGSDYTAINGPAICATAENHMTLSANGDGHHAMQGDQSFTVVQGGEHHSVDQDFSVTAVGTIHHDATQEYSVKVGGNEGHTANGSVSYNANGTISLTSATAIELIVGSNKIVIDTGGITIVTHVGDINVYAAQSNVNIYAPNGDVNVQNLMLESTNSDGSVVLEPTATSQVTPFFVTP